MEANEWLEVAKMAAKKAGDRILEVYESGNFEVEAKSDNSPLTLADKASHEAIVKELDQTGLPILSEEGKEIPFQVRNNWELFWMIDPLDGTKEFIKRNGEFTVNIALIKGNQPIMGVVYVPVTGEMYYASKGDGAFMDGMKLLANSFRDSEKELKIVASRSHLNDDTQRFINQFSKPVIVSRGSSLKLLMVASGEADLYPRYAPTMEWDTAAAQVIVEEAGGSVLIKDSENQVSYNKEDLLNPYFLVRGLKINS